MGLKRGLPLRLGGKKEKGRLNKATEGESVERLRGEEGGLEKGKGKLASVAGISGAGEQLKKTIGLCNKEPHRAVEKQPLERERGIPAENRAKNQLGLG